MNFPFFGKKGGRSMGDVFKRPCSMREIKFTTARTLKETLLEI